jgi:hypothetical protein
MAGLDAFRNSRVARTIDSYVNNKIGDQIRKIDDPVLRNGVGLLLDNFIPGIGGSTPDLRDSRSNTLRNLYREAYLGDPNNEKSTEGQDFRDINDPSDRVLSSSAELAKSYDWRARLRPKKGGENQFYSNKDMQGLESLLEPIKASKGLVWKHTPNIYMAASVEYNTQSLYGSNYGINTFQNATPPVLPVTGVFTANDVDDARYLLAVMTFLKVCTKAYYGDQAVRQGNYGTPPPVLLFEYLGDHGFNKVPVIVTSYTMDLPDTVDYVPVQVNGTVTYVPTMTTISISLLPSYTPHKLRRTFNLDRLASGAAYRDGYI